MPSLPGICMTAFLLAVHLSHIAIASEASAPLQLDLSVSPRTSRLGAKHLLLRDATPITAPFLYGTDILSITVNATIGTPPQQIEFILATNAADTVVLAANDSNCASHACGDAVFEASQSSTYQFVNSKFNIGLAGGTAGTGFYATDNFMLAGMSVRNLQFGLLLSGSIVDAILGVGYIALESAASSYANLPYRLYDQNSTDVNAFSIWFEGETSTSGKLSFGGIDTGKFNGSLESFTVSASNLSYQYTTITMSGVSASVNGVVTNFAGSSAPVVLDTSSTFLYLPNNTITQIAHFLGATFLPDYQLYALRYSAMKNGSTIDVILGSTVIHIPLEHITASANATHAVVYMSASGNDGNTLGVPFLRNAYTVFDYTHNQLSIAPLLKSNQSNVTTIPPNGVAGLRSTFKPNVTSSTNHVSNSTTSNPQSTSSTSSGHGLTPSAKLGVGLGVGLGVPLLLAVIAAVVVLRRRKLPQKQTPDDLLTPTAERHRQPGSSSTKSALAGLKMKFRTADDSSIPELAAANSQHNSGVR